MNFKNTILESMSPLYSASRFQSSLSRFQNLPGQIPFNFTAFSNKLQGLKLNYFQTDFTSLAQPKQTKINKLK